MNTSRMKKVSQSFWMMWEHVFDYITKYRSDSVWRFGICKLVIRKHYGNSLQCQDGQVLIAGDWVGELHLDNQQVIELSRTMGAERAGLVVARKLRQAMKQIRYALEHNQEIGKIQAIMGITLLHRGLIHGLGFELHPMKTSWSKEFTKLYLRLLLRVLHPEGKQRVKSQENKLVPMTLIMTKQALIQRWAQREQVLEPSNV